MCPCLRLSQIWSPLNLRDGTGRMTSAAFAVLVLAQPKPLVPARQSGSFLPGVETKHCEPGHNGHCGFDLIFADAGIQETIKVAFVRAVNCNSRYFDCPFNLIGGLVEPTGSDVLAPGHG